MQCHNRLDAYTDIKAQLSSIKSHIKDILKNISNFFVTLENTIFFIFLDIIYVSLSCGCYF